ncbi:glycosyltransferase [Geminocystis sp. GBBB08]|uniref:glycosyltransferase n=1 Tax=Geminocystis sp. GBBB08 TaxID=2604140 RepID=UPI0027E32706|nr:glycosyltransferase [Geminocystis sp. GBBB08]MBL1208320.1 glycosyltransferase family 4 protein [Geminocystis sp. GBBB08]
MTNKSKVSVLIPDLSSQGTTRGYIIAQGLQKLGYQVNIFGFLFGEQIYPEPPVGLPITYFHGVNLPSLIKLGLDLSAQIDGDILYVIKPQLSSFGLGLFKAWRSKKPIILDIDDWEMGAFGGDDWQYQGSLIGDFLSGNGELKKPQHPLYVKWLEKVIEKVNGITLSSKFLEYRYGGTYLPNVKDTDLFDPSKFDPMAIRAKYGLSDYRLLMFTGTPKPDQGLEDIFTALDSLNQNDLRLVLIGGNKNQSSYLKTLIDKWERWIIQIIPVAFDDMAEFIAMSHIVIVTPKESLTTVAKFPLELIEGMAMGKPIIATKVGEIPNILKDTGYLIEPQSPHAIAEKINLIFNDYSQGENKGNLARQLCINNYSMDNLTKTLAQVMSLFV